MGLDRIRLEKVALCIAAIVAAVAALTVLIAVLWKGAEELNPATNFNLNIDLTNLFLSAAVVAPFLWIAATFSRWVSGRTQSDGGPEEVPPRPGPPGGKSRSRGETDTFLSDEQFRRLEPGEQLAEIYKRIASIDEKLG